MPLEDVFVSPKHNQLYIKMNGEEVTLTRNSSERVLSLNLVPTLGIRDGMMVAEKTNAENSRRDKVKISTVEKRLISPFHSFHFLLIVK